MGYNNVSKGRFYAAYGSNLNLRQMRMRCPTAKVIASAVLKDYVLRFKGRPYSSYLTIEPLEGSEVPILIWKLKKEDEMALDLYEGVQFNHYSKEYIDVELNGKMISALTYVMNPEVNYGIPSKLYYQTVSEGYKNCGFPLAVLEQAYKDSVRLFSEAYEEENLFDLQ